jgi:hypothetical protein
MVTDLPVQADELFFGLFGFGWLGFYVFMEMGTFDLWLFGRRFLLLGGFG